MNEPSPCLGAHRADAIVPVRLRCLRPRRGGILACSPGGHRAFTFVIWAEGHGNRH